MNMEKLFMKHIELKNNIKLLEDQLEKTKEQIEIGMENRNAMRSGNYIAIIKLMKRKQLNKELLINKFGEYEIEDCYKQIEYTTLTISAA